MEGIDELDDVFVVQFAMQLNFLRHFFPLRMLLEHDFWHHLAGKDVNFGAIRLQSELVTLRESAFAQKFSSEKFVRLSVLTAYHSKYNEI